MDEEAQRLAADSDLEGARIERVAEGIKATLVMGILFDDGSAELTPSALDYLSKVAERLVEFPDTDILVVGHTDGQGSSELNLALSEARARAALEFLVSRNVDRSRLTAVGRGELEPLALDDHESDAAARENRRIELAISAGAAMKASASEGGAQ
jgi:outer membrane protein OmpA-like peptidoglycan-associated protein